MIEIERTYEILGILGRQAELEHRVEQHSHACTRMLPEAILIDFANVRLSE